MYFSEVDLRHQLPPGVIYPESVFIPANKQVMSVAVEKECQRLDELYGRPMVRCGKLDYMIRAIKPDTHTRSKVPMRKTDITKPKFVSTTKSSVTPITPSSTKPVSSTSKKVSEGMVIVPRRKKIDAPARTMITTKATSRPCPASKKRNPIKFPMGSPGSSPVKGPAAKFDVSDWPSDEDEMNDANKSGTIL